jgi:hypothetical protein
MSLNASRLPRQLGLNGNGPHKPKKEKPKAEPRFYDVDLKKLEWGKMQTRTRRESPGYRAFILTSSFILRCMNSKTKQWSHDQIRAKLAMSEPTYDARVRELGRLVESKRYAGLKDYGKTREFKSGKEIEAERK